MQRFMWPWLSRLKKSLTKDSTQRLFIKDYNLLDVFWGGTDEGKIENDWIGGVPFFDSLKRLSITSMLLNNFSILKRTGLEVEPILGANLTILILKEIFSFPKRITLFPLLATVPARAPSRLTIGNLQDLYSWPTLAWFLEQYLPKPLPPLSRPTPGKEARMRDSVAGLSSPNPGMELLYTPSRPDGAPYPDVLPSVLVVDDDDQCRLVLLNYLGLIRSKIAVEVRANAGRSWKCFSNRAGL